MGFTGLFLCSFLVIHLAGNLLLFAGEEKYDEYAHKLHDTGPLLVVAEVILFAAFAAHIYLAFVTTKENLAARSKSYAMRQSKKDHANTPSTISPENTMFITGAVILGYLIIHLLDFKFGVWSSDDLGPYAKAKELMSNYLRIGIYVVASLFVGYHVSHGFASAFQSLGINHPKINCCIKKISIGFAILIAAGFVIVSLWAKLAAHSP